MDKISVVVPVYNVKKYLEKSFESIADQTYDNLEIVLVDDGATDGSGKLCDELAMFIKLEITEITIGLRLLFCARRMDAPAS